MNPDSNTAVLVDPKSMKTVMVDIPLKIRDEWLSLEGLNNITSKLSQDEIKSEPVKINGHYIFLIYDDGKNIEVIYNTEYMDSDLDPKYIRPVTYVELMYLAIFDIKDKYPGFFTRYPVAGLGGIYPSKVYVKTTVKGRSVNLKINNVVYNVDEYPNLKEEYVKSVSVNSIHIGRLGADFDGDTGSLNIITSKEGVEEINKMLDSKEFYITPEGDITYSANSDTINLILAHMTA